MDFRKVFDGIPEQFDEWRPHKFYEGIREAIYSFGNMITLYDKITMYLARKP